MASTAASTAAEYDDDSHAEQVAAYAAMFAEPEVRPAGTYLVAGEGGLAVMAARQAP